MHDNAFKQGRRFRKTRKGSAQNDDIAITSEYGTAIAKNAMDGSRMNRRGWIRTTYEYKNTKALAMEGFHFNYRSFADCGLATR
ncbi:hypothetical protein [Paraburkholderia sp. SOS3]|uniref:hypothetical protein n=1 Tax=Paraburkholderia sp. SOS3 TaxID=1926494 RepID=UPI0012EB46FB|nr:hypothetical protein [Paraburkholderia sp. SOS3]